MAPSSSALRRPINRSFFFFAYTVSQTLWQAWHWKEMSIRHLSLNMCQGLIATAKLRVFTSHNLLPRKGVMCLRRLPFIPPHYLLQWLGTFAETLMHAHTSALKLTNMNEHMSVERVRYYLKPAEMSKVKMESTGDSDFLSFFCKWDRYDWCRMGTWKDTRIGPIFRWRWDGSNTFDWGRGYCEMLQEQFMPGGRACNLFWWIQLKYAVRLL